MPSATEKANSRRLMVGESPSLDLEYVVEGYNDQATALAALLEEAPTDVDGLILQSAGVTPEGDGSDYWIGTARYGTAKQKPPAKTGERLIRGRVGGGTEHTTIALEHLDDYAIGAREPTDWGGLIGADHTGDGTYSMKGVDVPTQEKEFSVIWYAPTAQVTAEYLDGLDALVGHANDAQAVLVINETLSRTYAEGELLFVDYDYSQRGEADWEFTFQFKVKKTRTNFMVGNIGPIDELQGWDYLWTEEEPHYDSAAKMTVMEVWAAHLDRVIPRGDFTALALHE